MIQLNVHRFLLSECILLLLQILQVVPHPVRFLLLPEDYQYLPLPVLIIFVQVAQQHYRLLLDIRINGYLPAQNSFCLLEQEEHTQLRLRIRPDVQVAAAKL